MQENQLRKAAILIANLEEPVARDLLQCLDKEEAKRVLQTATRLGHVDPEEVEAALEEFSHRIPTGSRPKAPSNSKGVELDPSLTELLERAIRETEMEASPNEIHAPAAYTAFPAQLPISTAQTTVPQGPFGFLDLADTEILISALKGEQPQTIALVLSCLENDRAAELILHLPSTMQFEVIKRLSELEPGDPESIALLAEELKLWIEDQERQKKNRERGLSTVQNILNAVNQKQHAALVIEIQQKDKALAERLGLSAIRMDASTSVIREDDPISTPLVPWFTKQKHPERFSENARNRFEHRASVLPQPREETPKRAPLPFEALEALDTSTWTRVLGQVEPELLTLALTMAPSHLIERIEMMLPNTRAVALRASLSELGPMRLADVDAAKRELCRIASECVLETHVRTWNQTEATSPNRAIAT